MLLTIEPRGQFFWLSILVNQKNRPLGYYVPLVIQFLRFSGIKDKAILTVTLIKELIGKLAYDKKKYIEFKALLENFLMKLSYANFIERNSSKHSIDSISQ